MKAVAKTTDLALDPLQTPKTSELAEASRHVLRQQALLAAWPVVIRLLRRVIDLTIGNGFLDQQWRLVKQENRDLYRLLSTLVAQNGGRLVIDEATWQRTRPDKRLLGKITQSGNTELVATAEPLLTRRAGSPSFWDGDGEIESNLILSNRGYAETGKEEPVFLPIFDVTRLTQEPQMMTERTQS